MEPSPYMLSASHSSAREDEFLSAIEKSKPLGGDSNDMGFTLYSTFPFRWKIQTIRSQTPLLRCQEIQTTRKRPRRDGFHPLVGLFTPMENPNHSELDTSTPLSGNPNHSESEAPPTLHSADGNTPTRSRRYHVHSLH